MLKNLFVLYLSVLLANTGVMASAIAPGDRGLSQSPRVALVIGNAHYAERSLQTPLADARAISNRFRDAGFDVIRLEDASRQQIEQAVLELNTRLGSTGTGLFYFAGHGLQVAGRKLLLPVDADTATARSSLASAVDIHDIVTGMSYQRPGQPNILIIDACLDNPFSNLDQATADAGSAASAPPLPEQTLLAFATTPGTVAYDGDGMHGIYTQELLHSLNAPLENPKQLFDRVQARVTHYTRNRQQPFTLSSPDLHILPYSAGAQAIAAAGVEPPPLRISRLQSMQTRGILPTDGDAKYELEFWQSIKNSTDASDYEAYLEAYPDGRFAPLAKARVKRYKKAEAPPPVPPAAKPAPRKPAFVVTEMDTEYDVLRNANVRKSPTSASTRVGELRRGSRVHVTGRVNGQNWYRVNSHGTTGFVFGELLQKPAPKPIARPAPVAEPPPPAPVVKQQAVKGIESIQDCPSCPEMLALPAGSFNMGDNRGDRSEKPAHKVSISKPFAIGKTEVTFGQWQQCYKAGACSYLPHLNASENSPVRDISWNDAREYTRWLSKLTNKSYRLPTEAEWEYAARAATTTQFWWGNKVGRGHADCKNCGGEQWDRKIPREVTTYPANPFGLYGTSGGVWEWVADCWHKSYQGAPKDGSAWNKADCRENVIRGGAWRNDSTYVHSASRFKYDSNVRYLLNGFRVARSLP